VHGAGRRHKLKAITASMRIEGGMDTRRNPLYVERRPRCIRCFGYGREGRFVPIDPEIASISRNRLEDFARQFGYFDQVVKGFILDGWMPSSREPRCQVYEPTKDED